MGSTGVSDPSKDPTVPNESSNKATDEVTDFQPLVQDPFEPASSKSLFVPANKEQSDKMRQQSIKMQQDKLLAGEQQDTEMMHGQSTETAEGQKDPTTTNKSKGPGVITTSYLGEPGDDIFNAALQEILETKGQLTPETLDKVEKMRTSASDMEKQVHKVFANLEQYSKQLWVSLRQAQSRSSDWLDDGNYFEAMVSFKILLDASSTISETLQKVGNIKDQTRQKAYMATKFTTGKGYWSSKSFEELQSLYRQISADATAIP